jgi:large subunit ribosomal protein L14e
MYDVGRICIKLAGRDAGGEAVIVDILDEKYVLIDGNVRRRKCNIMHLELTSKKVELKKGASHEAVKAAFGKLGLSVRETKKKEKAEKPKKAKKKKEKPEKVVKKKEKKKAKKAAKKAEPKKETKAGKKGAMAAKKPAEKKPAAKKEAPKKPAVKKKAAKK